MTTLVGPNSDTHVYTPTPSDAKKITDAKLVIVNGLGLEGWLPRLVKSSGSKAMTVVATKGVATLKIEDSHDHGPADADPHAWQSVVNAKTYVANIRDALIVADRPARTLTRPMRPHTSRNSMRWIATSGRRWRKFRLSAAA